MIYTEPAVLIENEPLKPVTIADMPNTGIPAPIVNPIKHTYDLPFGGNWWVAELDCPEQVSDLPEWMTKRGVWLMKSEILDDKYYAWMPVGKAEA